jgi:hypothetical protein
MVRVWIRLLAVLCTVLTLVLVLWTFNRVPIPVPPIDIPPASAPRAPPPPSALEALVTIATFSAASITQLLSSIDYPIKRIIVTWNGVQEDVGVALDSFREKLPTLEIYHHPVQIGCAGGWNRGILAAANASYWYALHNTLSE